MRGWLLLECILLDGMSAHTLLASPGPDFLTLRAVLEGSLSGVPVLRAVVRLLVLLLTLVFDCPVS
jgi:hypothetical protein